MSQELNGLSSAPSDAGAVQVVGASESSHPTTQDTSLASQGAADTPTVESVQGADTSTETDPFAFSDSLPSVDELREQARQGIKYADALASFKGAFDPLKAEHKELKSRWSIFEPVADRFEQPEQLQSVLELQDSLLGWSPDPDNPGNMIPATEVGAQRLAEQYPQHADYLTADLLALPTRDPATGQTVPRIDVVLAGMAADPEERARALKILGGVEPSTVAPQWQASPEEIAVVKPELQDFYRTLPWEDREELKQNSPEFINRTLEQLKLNTDLKADRDRYQQQEQQRQQQREQYVNQQAQQAADSYVNDQLNDALTTFHKSVVEQCQFIKPLDPANLPQGVSPEQAQQMNQQIDRANKSEAVQMTATVVGLLNPQVRNHILPLMKEVGLIDDKTLGQIENAANAFADNARNYGNITYRGKLQANGQGYQPDASVTRLNNEASRSLKALVGYGNQIRKALMDTRSGFFELRAQQHNETLNGSPQARPPINGSPFDPTRSVSTANQLPVTGMSRQQLEQLFG